MTMLDLLQLPSPSITRKAAAVPARYAGPERRAPSSQQHRRMAQMLDTLDYGMLLIAGERRVLHVNHAALHDLDASHPLQVDGNELRTRLAHDAVTLRDAISGAARRGLRRLIRLGDDDALINLAVVPLPALARELEHAVLLMLGKRQLCEELTLDWFARTHNLTMAETTVIKGLCNNLSPEQIAARQQVGIATIRTQIGSIRNKTGAGSIKALVQQVAMLPPLVGALPPAVATDS